MTAFFDTNVLVHAYSLDPRGEAARRLVASGGMTGVQCLNEFINVARNKLNMSWVDVHEALETIAESCQVVAPVDLDLHHQGLALAEQHGFAIFDALVVAGAIANGCDTLWSEDMQDGRVVGGKLTIRNPFLS